MNDAQYRAVRDACLAWRAKGGLLITGSWRKGDACCALGAYARMQGVTDEEGLTKLGLSASQVNQFLLGFDGFPGDEGHTSYQCGVRLRKELGL